MNKAHDMRRWDRSEAPIICADRAKERAENDRCMFVGDRRHDASTLQVAYLFDGKI